VPTPENLVPSVVAAPEPRQARASGAVRLRQRANGPVKGASRPCQKPRNRRKPLAVRPDGGRDGVGRMDVSHCAHGVAAAFGSWAPTSRGGGGIPVVGREAGRSVPSSGEPQHYSHAGPLRWTNRTAAGRLRKRVRWSIRCQPSSPRQSQRRMCPGPGSRGLLAPACRVRVPGIVAPSPSPRPEPAGR